MFENKIIKEEYATRYIASWVRKGGGLRYGDDLDKFRDWLKSLDISDDDVWYIYNLATCGKLELESSVVNFLNK